MAENKDFDNELGIDIGQMKQLLLDRLTELTAQQNKNDENNISKTVELDQTRQGRLSRMDALQMQAMAKEMERRQEVEVQRIKSALHRIEEGEYGYCVMTGDPIEKARLIADPSIPICLAAAKMSEK